MERGPVIQRVLILCTKNTNRSPIAEAAFNQLTDELGIPTRAVSAGVSEPDLGFVLSEAYSAAQRVGLTIPEGYLPRQVNTDLLLEADLVLTFSKGQRDFMRNNYGDSLAPRIFTLNEFSHSKVKVVDPSSGIKTRGILTRFGPLGRRLGYYDRTDRNFPRYQSDLYNKMAADVKKLTEDAVHTLVRMNIVTRQLSQPWTHRP